MSIVALVCAGSLACTPQAEARGGKGKGKGYTGPKYQGRGSQSQGGQGKQQNKPRWTPTSWQKQLPAIVVKDGGRTKKYSFEKLILADGYLCPGSAMAYMTLKTALPLLYGDAAPAKGDFRIMYGPCECATRVYNYFLGSKYRSANHLVCSDKAMGRQHMVVRKSTGAKVRITYDPPAADGHNPEAAEAADVVLKAEKGAGMAVEVVRPENAKE